MNIPKIFEDAIDARQERKKMNKLLTELDLIYGEFEILYLLMDNQPLQPSIIGSHLYCEAASVSRLIKLLSQKKLITYEHDDNDRRQIFVRLTKTGNIAVTSVLKHSCS